MLRRRTYSRGPFVLSIWDCLWAVIQDSQSLGFFGLPPAEGKLLIWLPSREVFCLLMVLAIGSGSWLVAREGAKTRRKTICRSVGSTRRQVRCAIRPVDPIGNPRSQSTEKLKGYPSRKLKWDGAFLGFAASRELIGGVARCRKSNHEAEKFILLRFLRMAVEFKASRSNCPLRSTRWDVW